MFSRTSDEGLWKKPLYVQMWHQSASQKLDEDQKLPDYVEEQRGYLPTPEQCNNILNPRTNPVSPFPTQSHFSPILQHLLLPHKKHHQRDQQADGHGAIEDDKDDKDNLITHEQQGQNGPLDLSTTKSSDLKCTSAKCHFALHKQNMHSIEKHKMNECEKSSANSNEYVDYAPDREDNFERQSGLCLLSNCAELMINKQSDKLSTKYENNQTAKTLILNEENQNDIKTFITRKIKQYGRTRRKRSKMKMQILDITPKSVKIRIKMKKLQNKYRKINQKLERLKSSKEGITHIELLSHSQEDATINSKKQLNKLQDVKESETSYSCTSSNLDSTDSKNEKKQLNPKSCDQCILTDGALVEGLKVLLRLDGVFHPGILKCILPPDIYGVLVEKERGNKPHILPREEVISQAIHDRRPNTVSVLSIGTRVCAFWSSKMNYLHPGTVAGPSTEDYVIIQLDDGDCRDIHIDQVRYLPENYPLQNATPSISEFKNDTNANTAKITTELQQAPHKKQKIRSKEMRKEKKTTVLLQPQLLWSWFDEGYQKSTKMYHNSIVKEEKTIRVGDCAVFLSAMHTDLPYIGMIESMWQTQAGKMKVKIKWFYHHAEVETADVGGARIDRALFSSNHFDVDHVQTISHKCQVLKPDEYKQRLETDKDLYWLAGEYDPLKRVIVHGQERLK